MLLPANSHPMRGNRWSYRSVGMGHVDPRNGVTLAQRCRVYCAWQRTIDAPILQAGESVGGRRMGLQRGVQSMSTPVLVTKLFIPPLRPNVVLRPRLIEQLNEGLHRKMTLISAPAGFGKTTLVSAWVAGIERPTAWLSLDDGDNDPTRFLLHLVAAVQTIAATIGAGVAGALRSSQPPPADMALTALLNEITTLPDRFVLVLDDYHLLDATSVERALTFLIEHLPPQLHLVIATREDPRLPLARFRAREHLTELRAADLRFTPAEAATFLQQAMGLGLSSADIVALEERTEGWIAGLQLAALSLRGHRDVPGFIRAFAGDHRYIADYLVDEVLQRQPAAVRNFLLQTAMLDRLTGSLCDAVTGQEGGSARLQALERGNFFIVPLDDQRRWYRYHHLFADVLAAHLLAEQPEQVPMLHRRASAWYEHHGLTADAIRHALAAGDLERAANLVERAIPEMRRSRQEATVHDWLRAFPDELVRRRPVLSAGYAWVLLAAGEYEAVEARLRDAERWLDTTADNSAMVVADHEEFRGLPGSIALWRAAQVLALGDVAGTLAHARRVFDLVAEDDHLRRGAAAGLLGLASWASGNLETAHSTYSECMARVQRAGSISDAIGCAIALADIRIMQGRLHEAMRTYEQALQLATERGEPGLRGPAHKYVGLSARHHERDDLDTATQHLLRSKELGELAGLPQNPYRWCVAMARIREAQGDLDGALDLLGEAERRYVSDFFPNVRPIAALKTRVWVVQGRLGEALGWARDHGLSVDDDLSYLREFDHITLARVLLAGYVSDGHTERSVRAAMALLARLLHAAEAGARTGRAIEILMLQARVQQAHGDIAAALTPLQRALTLAEPEGYVRLFVDEGPPMAQLLREAAARGIMPGYTGTLLAACAGKQQRSAGEAPLPTFPVVPLLFEPLSERERDVLRLLKTDLSGPEIASELVVALSTVRTHTKRIYEKLSVSTRRAAVTRAAELGLL
jgi:LuxR family maltose regulon positive regulatory protein